MQNFNGDLLSLLIAGWRVRGRPFYPIGLTGTS
jgi:hypothetical protein